MRVRVCVSDCALTPTCIQVPPPGFVDNVEPVNMMSAAGIVRAGELAVAAVEHLRTQHLLHHLGPRVGIAYVLGGKH